MLCVSQAKYESEITGLQKRLKDREAEMDETTNSHREAQVSLVSSTYIVIIIYYYCKCIYYVLYIRVKPADWCIIIISKVYIAPLDGTPPWTVSG